MEFTRCELIEETESTLRYAVFFTEEDMKAPLELAYGFLYRDAKIDVVGNKNPYGHLVEMIGEENISRYLGSFLQNYVANCVAQNEGFCPHGAPQVFAAPDEPSDEVKGLVIEYRKTPVYELAEYGPVKVVLPPGDFDEDEKAKRMVAVLKARFHDEIKVDDLMPVLDEMTRRFFRKLEMSGMSLEKYCKKHDINDERLHMLLFNEAVDEFKENMALDAIYRHEGLSWDERDERVVLLQIEPDRPDALKRQLEDTCFLAPLHQAAQRQAARRWLMETVEYVVDESLVDFGKMSGEEALDAIRQAVTKMAEGAVGR